MLRKEFIKMRYQFNDKYKLNKEQASINVIFDKNVRADGEIYHYKCRKYNYRSQSILP